MEGSALQSAQPPPGRLAEAEAEIADTKQAYYDALSRRNRALRALAREGGDE